MSALVAGALSKVSVGQTTASLSAGAASGGTGPYTYQWYRSTTSGFTPGVGNIISGATSLSLSDTGLLPGTTYYYKVVSTDAVPATVESTQLVVITAPAQNINQFSMASILGMLDQRFNYNTMSCEVDASESGTLYAGTAVKMYDSAGGVPKVVKCSANSDVVMGFVNYSIKDQSFVAGQKLEISQNGNVMYLISTGAIARGAKVTLDLIYVGGVASANSGDQIVGWAMDKATAAGQLIRVKITSPTFTVA